MSGPLEDKHDRAVFMYMAFPVVIGLKFRTDDWSRDVNWDDIVGFGALPSAPLSRLNLQLTLTGAPRSLSTGSGIAVETVPPEFVLKAEGSRGGHSIAKKKWSLSAAPKSAQPANPSQTLYRLSETVNDMGFTATPGERGVAVVQGGGVNFDVPAWADRGWAQPGVPSSESLDKIDSQRLMRAGGVEFIYLYPSSPAKDPQLRRARCLIRSPATVFFYSGKSGSGPNARCLSRAGECWISPDELMKHWLQPFAMDVLILAAPNVLAMTLVSGVAVAGPGSGWARLLRGKSPSGSLTAILGYGDDAPSTDVLREIAASMAARLAGGLSGAQFVDAWLAINSSQDAGNTWNAVGMDGRGYFWIDAERPDIRDKEWWKGGNKPVITGPVPIA
jgi:hypothetical protein